MRNLFLILLLSSVLLFSSCGVNNALVINQNMNQTEVQLSRSNFRVLDRVSGTADVTYILAIGGSRKRQLYATAHAAMLEAADLKGGNGSRALTNMMTEEHFGGLPPFYVKRTVTVSAHVVEFTQ